MSNIVRRFKYSVWPIESDKVDYLEYNPNRTTPTNGTWPKSSNCLPLTTTPDGCNLTHCIASEDLIELPCYVKDLQAGDIAIIKYHDKYLTVFVFNTYSDKSTLSMVAVNANFHFWSSISDNTTEVKALLGNSFDTDRITYAKDFNPDNIEGE